MSCFSLLLSCHLLTSSYVLTNYRIIYRSPFSSALDSLTEISLCVLLDPLGDLENQCSWSKPTSFDRYLDTSCEIQATSGDELWDSGVEIRTTRVQCSVNFNRPCRSVRGNREFGTIRTSVCVQWSNRPRSPLVDAPKFNWLTLRFSGHKLWCIQEFYVLVQW